MAENSIRIEYNQELEPLKALLAGVQRAGDFFVSGTVEIPMPKVEVEGVGVLSFPVPPLQIAALIQQATRAPYGRGEATILDESVRKVWQLSPDLVRIGGKSWAASFDGILKQVITGLGCTGMAVSAELYKLLVYDTGGFFLAHRDTEKAGGMFGTLVVVLPAAHSGGELVIRHAGRETIVDMSRAEVSEAGFAAFYADCEHEVRPITGGNRVCLIFNLIQQPGVKNNNEALHAPDYEKEIAAVAALLQKNLSEPGAPAKIAWLLEHQYSPDGLSFAGLKSADAARAQVLAQAAERARCAVHLGIVHIEESGSAAENYQDYRPRGRWGRYQDEEEIENAHSDDFEVIEVCDWRHYLSQWRNLRDEAVDFGEIPLAPGELLPAGALDDEKPDEQRLMEASGNEGASFERSYHRAALVIWRHERYAEVLLQAGVAAVLPYLKERIEACNEKKSPPAAREEAVALARLLLKAWKDAAEFGTYSQPGRPDKRDEMLRLLNQLGDSALLAEFIAEVVTLDYDGSENAALVEGAMVLGPGSARRLFSELVRQQMQPNHAACVDLLHALVACKWHSECKTWQNGLRQIAEAAVGKLNEIGKKQREYEWTKWRDPQKARALDAALVAKLLGSLAKLDTPALRVTAVEAFAARPDVFDPVTILVPALAMVPERDAAVKYLWKHGAEFLLQRSSCPPESPHDWRQDVKLSCSCVDCCELQKFVLDPLAQTYRFRVRQDRRQHLHQQIEKHSLDMAHVTDRRGSPQTLVCTKDRRSYQRRCDQYRKDIAALAQLSEMSKTASAGNPGVLNRIDSARALAEEWSPA